MTSGCEMVSVSKICKSCKNVFEAKGRPCEVKKRKYCSSGCFLSKFRKTSEGRKATLRGAQQASIVNRSKNPVRVVRSGNIKGYNYVKVYGHSLIKDGTTNT